MSVYEMHKNAIDHLQAVLLIVLVFCVVVFGGIRAAHRFNFLYCFCFVCLRPVSCVPNVASFSGLSIRDCPFRFSLMVN